MAIRIGEAQWRGDLRQGSGTVSTQSGVLEKAPYSFGSRMQDGPGTNPEELLGAAHAGCFAMAAAHGLSTAGHPPTELHATARVHLVQQDGGFAIPLVELELEARVPGIDEADFQRIVADAKADCPVSKLFAGAAIRLRATLR
ncbi:MAG: OsmC family protein [Gemmatimonadota bacterium]